MGIHYPKNFVGRCKQAKLVPVTIGIGSDIHWQGGVDQDTMMEVMALQQKCQQNFPAAELPPKKERKKKAETAATPQQNTPQTSASTPPAAPSAERHSTGRGK